MSDPWEAQREALGSFIHAQRKMANLSLRQLAELTSLSNPYLSQLERGLHQPSVRVLKLISDALNVSAETLLRVIQRRESLGSTGMGRGIAIPHCRSLVANRLRLAYGRHRQGVEFQAIDGKPVFDLFLIVAPPLEVSNLYLPVLGKIAQFAKESDVPGRLAALGSPDEFFRLLEEKGV